MSTSYSTKSKRPGIVHDNFLEALRDLGKGVVTEAKTQLKQAVTTDIPESFGLAHSGTINPNESVSLDSLKQAEKKGEEQAASRFRQQLEQMRSEERARFQREEAETKEQIKAIQQEIMQIAQAAGNLANEVQIAAVQAPVNPGIYHKNFFAQLRSFLASIRKRVQDSQEWLATTNARASQKGFYWNQVSKSGSKYMLSSERYMVTSTG